MSIILASASPRRQELLKQIGCDFTVMVSEVTEDNTAALSPVEFATSLAAAKAADVAGKVTPADIVVGADTIVVLEGRVYGKPRDRAHACEMLAELAGRQHQVITGIAVAAGGQVLTDHCITTVKIRPLSDQEIADYVATGEPMDKAGAYAIQGIGALLVEGIDGCYPNVVGLPLVTLQKLLQTIRINLL